MELKMAVGVGASHGASFFNKPFVRASDPIVSGGSNLLLLPCWHGAKIDKGSVAALVDGSGWPQ